MQITASAKTHSLGQLLDTALEVTGAQNRPTLNIFFNKCFFLFHFQRQHGGKKLVSAIVRKKIVIGNFVYFVYTTKLQRLTIFYRFIPRFKLWRVKTFQVFYTYIYYFKTWKSSILCYAKRLYFFISKAWICGYF